MKLFTFPKKSKIKSQRTISELFTRSNSYGKKPLRILWNIDSIEKGEGGLKVLVAVPKKKIKRAIDRNRIKRLIRESFRLNKNTIEIFLKEKKVNCNLGILYNSNTLSDFESINESIKILLDRFKDEYEKSIK